MSIDIEKLNDTDLDSLQKRLDERGRKREIEKHPMRGFRSVGPRLAPGTKVHHRTAFEIDAVANRVKDRCGQLAVALQQDDEREFARELEHLANTIDSEITRGFEDFWSEVGEEGREILLDSLAEVEQTLQMIRARLTSRAARIDAMLKSIATIELPKPPLSHRAGEAIAETMGQVKETAGAIAAAGGKVVSKAAQGVKSLLL